MLLKKSIKELLNNTREYAIFFYKGVFCDFSAFASLNENKNNFQLEASLKNHEQTSKEKINSENFYFYSYLVKICKLVELQIKRILQISSLEIYQ